MMAPTATAAMKSKADISASVRRPLSRNPAIAVKNSRAALTATQPSEPTSPTTCISTPLPGTPPRLAVRVLLVGEAQRLEFVDVLLDEEGAEPAAAELDDLGGVVADAVRLRLLGTGRFGDGGFGVSRLPGREWPDRQRRVDLDVLAH